MSDESKALSARRPITNGILAVAILVGGFGGWSVMAEISGAVVTSGRIVNEKNRQAIQHPDGGVVEEILVSEGDRVTEGDVLLRLDPTNLASQLAVVEGQYFELLARTGRLEAERDGQEEITFAPELTEEADQYPEIADMMDGQISLFKARRVSVDKELQQLGNRRAQLQNQVAGIEAQIRSFQEQMALVREDLESQQSLLDKGLTQANRVTTLQRETARLLGVEGEALAQKAEILDRVAEIEIQEVQLMSQRREDAISLLRDIQYNERQLGEERRLLKEQMSRLDVRAPIDGIVHDMQVFGRRSVVTAANPVLFLVPQDRPLFIRTQVLPIDIDQVNPGQPVILKFGSFDTRDTPDLEGFVSLISPNTIVDERSGASYYEVEVQLPENELSKLPENASIVPGMPVDVFLRTEDKSPIAYIVQPLGRYFERAFKDT